MKEDIDMYNKNINSGEIVELLNTLKSNVNLDHRYLEDRNNINMLKACPEVKSAICGKIQGLELAIWYVTNLLKDNEVDVGE